MTSEPASPPASFTSFLPLTLLSLAFLILLGNEILTLKTTTASRNATLAQRTAAADEAGKQVERFQNFASDLRSIAPKSPAAAQISRLLPPPPTSETP